MFVLCSYKILNSHDIYKDTFIQALHYIHYNTYLHKINHFIIPDKDHFYFLFNSLYMITSMPAFPISRRFQSFQWTSPKVENILSTPALDQQLSISVSSLLVSRSKCECHHAMGLTEFIISGTNMYWWNGPVFAL